MRSIPHEGVSIAFTKVWELEKTNKQTMQIQAGLKRICLHLDAHCYLIVKVTLGVAKLTWLVWLSTVRIIHRVRPTTE
jgi:hypothetical protein